MSTEPYDLIGEETEYCSGLGSVSMTTTYRLSNDTFATHSIKKLPLLPIMSRYAAKENGKSVSGKAAREKFAEYQKACDRQQYRRNNHEYMREYFAV